MVGHDIKMPTPLFGNVSEKNTLLLMLQLQRRKIRKKSEGSFLQLTVSLRDYSSWNLDLHVHTDYLCAS